MSGTPGGNAGGEEMTEQERENELFIAHFTAAVYANLAVQAGAEAAPDVEATVPEAVPSATERTTGQAAAQAHDELHDLSLVIDPELLLPNPEYADEAPLADNSPFPYTYYTTPDQNPAYNYWSQPSDTPPPLVPPTPATSATTTETTKRRKRKADDNGDENAPRRRAAPRDDRPGDWAPRTASVSSSGNGFTCPGLNNDCFHQLHTTQGYWDHIKRVHGLSRKHFNLPGNEHLRDIFLPPRREDWFLARGYDVTYRGTDRKHMAARRRMAAGVRPGDPGYGRLVYGSTMGVADVGPGAPPPTPTQQGEDDPNAPAKDKATQTTKAKTVEDNEDEDKDADKDEEKDN